MVTIGIDAGLTGAIAFLFDDVGVAIEDIPTCELDGGGSVTRRVDARALRQLLTGHCRGQQVRTYIETLATGGQGRGNMMTAASQYRTRGAIEAVLELCGLTWVDVAPQRWKRMYPGLGGGPESKGASLAMARQLYAGAVATTYLPLAKHHNRAEALLIAHFARKALA